MSIPRLDCEKAIKPSPHWKKFYQPPKKIAIYCMKSSIFYAKVLKIPGITSNIERAWKTRSPCPVFLDKRENLRVPQL